MKPTVITKDGIIYIGVDRGSPFINSAYPESIDPDEIILDGIAKQLKLESRYDLEIQKVKVRLYIMVDVKSK